jgi:alanyl-tRNA synthetase
MFEIRRLFKEEAILHAWKFVNEELQLPSSSLRLTYLHGDDEARNLWKETAGDQLMDSQVIPLGKADNFWTMGGCHMDQVVRSLLISVPNLVYPRMSDG